MRVLYHTRPYESVPGEADRVHEQLNERCKSFLMKKHPSWKGFKRLCSEIVETFDNIPVTNEVKPRVGIVGEILVKFSPSANNGLVDLLEAEESALSGEEKIRSHDGAPGHPGSGIFPRSGQ